MAKDCIKIDEKCFEDILFEHLQTEDGCKKLLEKGLYCTYDKHSILLRQVNLHEYGILDLVRVKFKQGEIDITVLELKVVEFNIAHLIQLGRYLSGIRHLIVDSKVSSYRFNLYGVIVVNGFDSKNDYVWLEPMLNNRISIYNTTYTIDGIRFDPVFRNSWRWTVFDKTLEEYISKYDLKLLYQDFYQEAIRCPQADLQF